MMVLALAQPLWGVGRSMGPVVHPLVLVLILLPFVIAAIAAVIKRCSK